MFKPVSFRYICSAVVLFCCSVLFFVYCGDHDRANVRKQLKIVLTKLLLAVLSFLVQMMLVDAGRRQEALELDDTLLGYLRQDGFKEGEGDDAADTRGILSANG